MVDWVLEMAALLVVFVVVLAIPDMIVADQHSGGRLRKTPVPRKPRGTRRRVRRAR